jgi:hypothetical protein
LPTFHFTGATLKTHKEIAVADEILVHNPTYVAATPKEDMESTKISRK